MAALENNNVAVIAAYQEMRRHADASGSLTSFPISILMEWDKVRCKLNPEARLSYAQKLLQEHKSS